MDEATSSVNKATDTLIQRSIRECIPRQHNDRHRPPAKHRCRFNKTMVLPEGGVIEFEEPKVLMERKGVFWKMIQREMVQRSEGKPELEARALSSVSP